MSLPTFVVADAPTDGATNIKPYLDRSLAAAAVRGGGAVVLPYAPAGYALDGQVVLPSGVVLRGENRVAVRKVGASTASAMVATAAGAEGCGIEDITLDAAGLLTGAVVLPGRGTQGFTLEHVRITDRFKAGQGILTSPDMVDFRIRDCDLDALTTSVYLRSGASNVTIEDVRIRNWQTRGIYCVGTATDAAVDVKLRDVRITDLAPGGPVRQPIVFEGVDSNPHRIVRVLDCTIVGPGKAWTAADPGTADQIGLHRVEDFVIRGNVTRGGGDCGMAIAAQSRKGIIEGNICEDNDTAGICVGSATAKFTRSVAVTGNTSVNNGQNRNGDRSYGRCGVYLYNASHVTVSGNNLSDDQATPTQLYGIYRNTTSGIKVEANNYAGTTRAQLIE